jgi:hypothetical protein
VHMNATSFLNTPLFLPITLEHLSFITYCCPQAFQWRCFAMDWWQTHRTVQTHAKNNVNSRNRIFSTQNSMIQPWLGTTNLACRNKLNQVTVCWFLVYLTVAKSRTNLEGYRRKWSWATYLRHYPSICVEVVAEKKSEDCLAGTGSNWRPYDYNRSANATFDITRRAM